MTSSLVFSSPLLLVCFVHNSSFSSLSASLLVWVFLAASLSPHILVRSRVAVFVMARVCKFRGAEPSRSLGCSVTPPGPSWMPRAGWRWRYRHSYNPSRAELSPEAQVKRAGARDHSGTHPATRTRDAKCYFYSSALLLPQWSLFPPSSASCSACVTAGYSVVHVLGGLIIITAIPKLPVLYRSALNSGLSYQGLPILIWLWIAEGRSFKHWPHHSWGLILFPSNHKMLAAERCWGSPDNRVSAWKRQIFMALCRTCRFPWGPNELNMKLMYTMVDIIPWLNSAKKKKVKRHLHVKTSKTSTSHVIRSVKMQCYPRKFCYSKNHIVGVYLLFHVDFLHKIHSGWE